MVKNNRISFVLAVIILLGAAVTRYSALTRLPPGLNAEEILDIRLSENARQGYIQVFYNLNGEGREGFYHIMLAAVTSLTGRSLLGYHILAAWLGMTTIALLYALARRLYGNFAGLAAMGLFAFSLYPLLLSRTIGRETLLPLLTTAILLALSLGLPVYWRRRGNQTQTTAFAALGILLGVSFYIHPAGLVLVGFAVMFVIYILFLRQQVTRQLLSFISFVALVLLIIVTPYLVSAIRLPELGGVTRLLHGLFNSDEALLERALAGVLAIGIRGDANPVYNVPGRPLFDPISAGLMLVGIVGCLRYLNKPRYMLPFLGFVLLMPLALFSPDSPTFPAYASVLPILALLFGLGINILHKWIGKRFAPIRDYAWVFLGVLLVLNGVWMAVDLNRWAVLPEVQTAYNTRLQQLARRIDRTSGTFPTVVCVQSVDPTVPRVDLTNSQLMGLMMHRQTSDIRYVDCDQGLLFIEGGGLQQVIFTESDALQTANPFVLEWLQQARPVGGTNLPADSVWIMEVASALADTVGKFTTTTPVIYPPESPQPNALVSPPMRLGGNLTFLGYQTPDVDFYPPGGIVTVVTYWRVDGVVPPDLTLFTHILADPAAQPIAQHDTISVNPAELKARDVFIQVTYVPLSELMPVGEYTVSIGAYQGGDKQRMAVLDADGHIVANRVFLYVIDVHASDE